ncbi:MAG: hypothetical protein ACP5FL_07910 [Thermoplasmatota archaeon]
MTYGGPYNDGAHTIRETTGGGYIVAGYTQSYGAGGTDLWLIRLDTDGNEVWNATYGGLGNERGGGYGDTVDVRQTTDNGFIMVGTTGSFGVDAETVWLVKTDADGLEQWNQTFGTRGNSGDAVLQTSDDGYIIAATTNEFGKQNESDVWLIKTDAYGTMVWDATFGGDDYERARAVLQTLDGGYLVLSDTMSFGGIDVWLIKTDAQGNMLWNTTIGGAAYDFCYAVAPTADSGYILTGRTASYGDFRGGIWLVKIDAMGATEWIQAEELGPYSSQGHSVQQTSDGGFIVTGDDGAGAVGDMLLIKTDATGIKEWDLRFGGQTNDSGRCVLQISDGSFIVAGYTDSFGAGERDAWIVKQAGPPSIYIEISGGFGLTVTARNLAGEQLSNLPWSIDLSMVNGSLLFGATSSGTIDALPADEEMDIRVIPFGLGIAEVRVMVADASLTTYAGILGPFTYVDG